MLNVLLHSFSVSPIRVSYSPGALFELVPVPYIEGAQLVHGATHAKLCECQYLFGIVFASMGQVRSPETRRKTGLRSHSISGCCLQASSVQMTQRDVDEVCLACDHVCTLPPLSG